MGSFGVEAAWVQAENAKPGTTAWAIPASQSGATIAGFADTTAASLGQRVALYVSTAAPRFRVEAFRMGYYGGLGARLIWRSPMLSGVPQPTCAVVSTLNTVSCASWRRSVTISITRAWVQGDYLLKLVADPGQASYVPLTVWDPASRATYVVQNSVLTWEGWNTYGGYNCFGGAPEGKTPQFADRARAVSFDRPYNQGEGAADYLGLELPFVRFAEQHSLDVTYWTDIVFSEHPGLLVHHKALVSLGHNEFWTQTERQGVLAGRDAGVNLAFLGATPILRHARLEPTALGSDRLLVDYRNPQDDPIYRSDPAAATGNTFAQPPANEPPSEIVGDTYGGYGINDPMVITDAGSWLFAGTGLHNGSALAGVVAGDYDHYQVGADPANVEVLTNSPVLTSYGHRDVAQMTYYSLPNGGAGVVATGTIGWIPAMTTCGAGDTTCPAPTLDRIVGNILVAFGSGPAGRLHPSIAVDS